MIQTKLPRRLTHTVPMPLKADAYTVGSENTESLKAKEKSVYYITFRRILEKINPDLYNKNDNRIIFHGLSRLIEYLLYDPTSIAEIVESEEFLKTALVTTEGLKPHPFPKHLWERVVKEFNGRPPIRIRAVLEGSVVYPNEPVVVIESMVDGFGQLAAWFESTLLKVWSSSEMVTQLMHWLEYCESIVYRVYGDTISREQRRFLASLMLHNFGCRAGITPQESEWLGSDALLVFSGTDTFTGAYQTFKNSLKPEGLYTTVPALAHRNVQSFPTEKLCYDTMYHTSPNGTINSMVCDCYQPYTAVEDYLLPLAQDAKEKNNGKVVVARFDSGNPGEQILWLCKIAHKHGLSDVVKILNKEWRFGTTLKTLEGDSMSFKKMKEINEDLMLHGFPPFAWGPPYGVGNGLRDIKRDNLSAKYALCAMGNDLEGVCKFSDTIEKTTLPGPFKLLRNSSAIGLKETIVHISEPGEDVMVTYFDGTDIYEPFKEGYGHYFDAIKQRIQDQWNTMPKNLCTEENHNYPISSLLREKRKQLLRKHAPKKLEQNY